MAVLLPLLGLTLARATNVLLVVADDLGVDKVGAYADLFPGYEAAAAWRPATPTLDALAASGLRFTRAWADPVCSPSRFALQTGQEAWRVDIGRPLADGATGPDWTTHRTVAARFAERGWATALFGKWHLGDEGSAGTLDWTTPGVYPGELPNPVVAGYGAFAGFLDADVDSYSAWTQVRRRPGRLTTVVEEMDAYAPLAEVDEAAAWIAVQPGPWLVTLAFAAPHRSGAGNYAYTDVDASCVRSEALLRCLDGTDTCDEHPAAYAGLVECLDTALGELLTEIDPTVLADTLVVVTSDNGTPHEAAEWRFADPELDGVDNPDRGKDSPYLTGVHVPLLVTDGATWLGAEGGIPLPGRDITLPVGLVDLAPTVLEVATGLGAGGMDGRSFADCLVGEAEDCGRAVMPTLYAEAWYPDVASAGGDVLFGAALAVGDHTLVVTPALNAHGAACRSPAVYRTSTDYWQTSPLLDPALTALLERRMDARGATWMLAYPWC